RIARKAIEEAQPLGRLRGRSFYAVGGTWRALARLHMRQHNYPLDVMHNYRIPAEDAVELASLLERVDSEALAEIASVSAARRPLLAYGAIVLDEVIRRAKPREIVISAAGVREGLLYERLPEHAREEDPLVVAARELERSMARAPGYGDDLIAWTDALIVSSGLEETREERRLRHAACFLSDVSWRAHPDYRASQSMNVITNSAFVAVDHPGRAFLALVAVLRHAGPDSEGALPVRGLLTTRLLERARLLSAALRVGYLLSAAMPGVLPRAPIRARDGRLVLSLPANYADLVSERLTSRAKALARLLGMEAVIEATASV
ncbi:MAG TPA: exopolyphosphatase, partial [Methylosinus sp.]